jgi:hypothetical protein
MEKKFNCLKMKEEIQAKIYEETKDMTFSELDAYFNKGLESHSLWQRLAHRDNVQRQNKKRVNAGVQQFDNL